MEVFAPSVIGVAKAEGSYLSGFETHIIYSQLRITDKNVNSFAVVTIKQQIFRPHGK